MADVNLHLKLCKKVAQLTKVIHHLNTKNEDYEATVKALTEQHDAELQDVLEDAAGKIRQLKDALAIKSQGGISQEQLRRVESKYEEERQKAMREFAAYQNKVSIKEEHLRAEFKSRVKSMQRELDEAKDNFRKRVDQWDAQASDLVNKADKNDKSVTKLKKDHEKELKKLKSTHDEELQAQQELITTLQDKLELLEKSHAKRDIDYKARLAKLQEEAQQREHELLQEKEKVLAGVRSEVESSESTMLERIAYLSASLESEKKATATAVQELERRSQELDCFQSEHAKETQALRSSLDQAYAQSKGFEIELLRTTTELSSATEATEVAEARLRDLEMSIERERTSRQKVESSAENANDQILSLERKLKEQAKLGSQHVRELQEKLVNKEKEIKRLDGELREARSQVSSLGASLADEKDRATTLQVQVTTLSAGKIENMQKLANQQKEIHELQSNINNAKIEADALREALSTAKTRNEESQRAHIAERNALQEAHAIASEQAAREMRNLQNNHRDALNKLRQEIETESNNLHERAQLQQASLVTKLEEAKQAELKALEATLLEKLRDQAVARSQAESEVVSTRADLEATQQDLEAVREAKGHVEIQLAEATTQVNSLQERLHIASGDLAGTKTFMSKMMQEHEESIVKLNEANEAKLSVALAEERKRAQEIISLTRAELQASAAATAADLKKELLDYQTQANARTVAIERLEKEKSDVQLQYEARMGALKQKHQKVLEDLRRESKENILKEQTSWQAKLEETRRTLAAEKEGAIRKLETRYTEKERIIRKDHEQSREMALEGLRVALQQEASSAKAQIEASHRESIESLRRDLGKQRAASEQQLQDKHTAIESELRKQVALAQTERDSLNSQVKRLATEIEQLQITFDDKVASMEQDRSREQKRHEVHLENLRRAHEDQVRSLTETNARDAQAQREDREHLRKQLENEISQLQKTIQYWEHRYEHREPRAEDLKHIAKLNKKLEQAEVKVRHAVEEMQFYKLELRNREDSYNKVFNRNVNVGVMQVLKPSSTLTGSNTQQPTFGTFAEDDDNSSIRSKKKDKKKKKDKDRSKKSKHKHRSHADGDSVGFPPLDNHSIASNQRPPSSSRRRNVGPEEPVYEQEVDEDNQIRARDMADRDAAQLVNRKRVPIHPQTHRRIVNM